MSKPVIAIGRGHGLYTAGKRCLKSIDPNETREWALNDRIADKVESKLANYECDILVVGDTTGAKDVSLASRVKAVNKANPVMYISIHHNAGIYGKAGGGTIIYYYSSKTERKVQAQKLYNAIVKETGLVGNRCDKIKSNSLYVLRKTTCPALLIENGFMDSTVDTPIILTEEHAEKTAVGIVNFLVEEFGLKEKKVVAAKKSVEEIAKEVIAGKWGNGATRRAKLHGAGYDYAEVQKVVNAIVNGETTKVTESPYYPKYTGTDHRIDKVFETIGVPGTYRGKWNKRKPIATANGIKNYIGSGTQNAKLMKLAKQGKLLKP